VIESVPGSGLQSRDLVQGINERIIADAHFEHNLIWKRDLA
jgi:hypothetical protein